MLIEERQRSNIRAPERGRPRESIMTLIFRLLVLNFAFLFLTACASPKDRHHDNPMPAPTAYQAHFGDLDADGDDRVSPEEFKAHFPEGDMDVFNLIDADRSGEINHDEWHRFKEAHGMADH